MSLTIVRMNTASSQTSTVLLTLPPLSDDLLNQCLDVEHTHTLAVDLYHAGYYSRGDAVVGRRVCELIHRHVVNVPNVVDAPPLQTLEVVHEQRQAVVSRARGFAQRDAAVNYRHDRAPQIDQSAHGVGCARQSCQPLSRRNLAKRLHV